MAGTMETMKLGEIDDRDWEQLQEQLGGHLLQSAPWAKFQAAMGRKLAGRVKVEGGSAQAFLMSEAGIKYLWVPYGPTVADKTGAKLLERSTWQSSGVDFIRFEPMGAVREPELLQAGAIPSMELNPAHTMLIDLTKSEEELRGDLTAGHRNAINGAARRGLSFELGDETDVTRLLDFIHQTGRRKHFRPHPDSYYQQMMKVLGPAGVAKIYVAKHGGRTIAVAVVFDYQGTRIYAHAAADPAARQLQAAVPLVWYLLLEAKQAGMKQLDLWGVAAADAPPNHPWTAFRSLNELLVVARQPTLVPGIYHSRAGTIGSTAVLGWPTGG